MNSVIAKNAGNLLRHTSSGNSMDSMVHVRLLLVLYKYNHTQKLSEAQRCASTALMNSRVGEPVWWRFRDELVFGVSNTRNRYVYIIQSLYFTL